MNNRWTGGQYSLFRAVFALYVLTHFLHLLPCTSAVPAIEGLLPHGERNLPSHLFPNVLAPTASSTLAVVLRTAGIVLSVLFGIGLYDRAAALGLWCVWTWLFYPDPRVPFVGWLLLAHLFVPPAPYGSWAARGRVDPAGGWRMPPALFATAWFVLALMYAYDGCMKLVAPSWRDGTALTGLFHDSLAAPAWLLRLGTWTLLVLELAFAPLALLPRLRPWLWSSLLMIHLALFVLLGLVDWSLGLLMVHLFTADPGWIPPRTGGTERVFYDGHCGLCQRSVRLLLAEDATGTAFRFAPLQGETFTALVPEEQRAALPLSLVVQTEKGTLLTRSAGVLHIQRRLGGVWRLLAGLLFVLPPVVRDRLYDGVARIRLHLFAPPPELCPLMPPQIRTRFDP